MMNSRSAAATEEGVISFVVMELCIYIGNDGVNVTAGTFLRVSTGKSTLCMPCVGLVPYIGGHRKSSRF